MVLQIGHLFHNPSGVSFLSDVSVVIPFLRRSYHFVFTSVVCDKEIDYSKNN
jgi:hypothetical protein